MKAQLTVQVAARCHRLLLHTICRWRKTTREGTGTQSRRRPIEIVSLELFLARCGAAPAKAGVCWEGNLTCSEGLSSGGSRGLSTSLAGPGTHPQRPRRPSLPPPPGRSPCLAWSPWIGFVSEEGGGKGVDRPRALGLARDLSSWGQDGQNHTSPIDAKNNSEVASCKLAKLLALALSHPRPFLFLEQLFLFFFLFFFPPATEAKPNSSRTS